MLRSQDQVRAVSENGCYGWKKVITKMLSHTHTMAVTSCVRWDARCFHAEVKRSFQSLISSLFTGSVNSWLQFTHTHTHITPPPPLPHPRHKTWNYLTSDSVILLLVSFSLSLFLTIFSHLINSNLFLFSTQFFCLSVVSSSMTFIYSLSQE